MAGVKGGNQGGATAGIRPCSTSAAGSNRWNVGWPGLSPAACPPTQPPIDTTLHT